MTLELSDEETEALAALLSRAIDDDRYPLSPRMRHLESDPGQGRAATGARAIATSAKALPTATGKRGEQTWQSALKSAPSPPMTLGNAAKAAGVHLIVWCKNCQHQVEPDPAEQARRCGAEMPVPEVARAACVFRMGQPGNRYGLLPEPSDAPNGRLLRSHASIASPQGLFAIDKWTRLTLLEDLPQAVDYLARLQKTLSRNQGGTNAKV
jgi:hypothetical protein